nr:retrovirus-related Pol polyprotein from transposon TNT 1-94 [Tanacetum cinerariifolium]
MHSGEIPTLSKGYRVYNKRTRLIVESIHLRFDDIKEMNETTVANDTSGLVPQRQKASDYDNSGLAPQLQNVSPSTDTTVPSQQELDLLFGSNLKDTQPTTNIQPTSASSTPTYVHAEENSDDQAEEDHLPDDEFTNPFCEPAQEVAESSSHNIGSNLKDTQPTTNIQPTSAPSTPTYVHAEENSDDQAEEDHLPDDEFTNPFSKEYAQEEGIDFEESFCSSCTLGSCLDFHRICSTQVFSNLSDGRENGISQWSTEFLGDKLVSWMSKKQYCTAMSSAKAEYVALSASCAQVMWMRT